MKVIGTGAAHAIRKKGAPIIVGEPEIQVISYDETLDVEHVLVAVKFGFEDQPPRTA